jgi:hypothetical protein
MLRSNNNMIRVMFDFDFIMLTLLGVFSHRSEQLKTKVE